MSVVGLEPTTLDQAATLMAGNLGLSWPEDRSEIVEYVNDFRDILYNSYDELKLFNNAFHCIRVASFPTECGRACLTHDTFQGFVLPEDVMAVETAWEYGFPLKVRSRWRESHLGLDNEALPRIAVTETAQQVCTERPLTHETTLMVYADDEEDAGREVHIEVTTNRGDRKTFKFELITDGWAEVTLPVNRIHSVSLPGSRKGNVTLAQKDGTILSIYGPHETVPSYRLFRVASTCRKDGTILIQGVKRFRPVYCDHDIVEVGSRSVLKAAASYLKFEANTTDAKSINRATYDNTKMGQYLIGLHSRSKGNAKQDPLPMSGRRVNTRTVMPGYES